MNITLPPCFRIDKREDGNFVRQIGEPLWVGEATVQTFNQYRLRGLTITPADGTAPVLVLQNSSKRNFDNSHILRFHELDHNPSATTLDFSDGNWLKHPQQQFAFNELADYERYIQEIRDSWTDAFVYKRENSEASISGLRPPQLGSIYAVQAHWTVNSEIATVVLPTGVGKTETMLSLMIAERCERLMVVVPTDALRTQIADKFLSLGLLKTLPFAVVQEKALYPVVGMLNKRPQNVTQVDSLFKKCNVIVTTMPLASQCSPEVMTRMAELCSCLFIDEAHHVAAPTWKEFKKIFEKNRIIQFTATPFRNDDQPIGGKRIFTFSLRHAQDQGYFKQIHFTPVTEFNPAKKDSAIADAAVKQLRKDAHLGHILMARVGTVARANEVFEYYKQYSEFNPVQIHTGISSKAARDEVRKKLLSGESRIVVCVDMLGEGFDLPELKIAAFHDIRKTLAVTLQLVGRFTRSKPQLGNATFVANIADLEVKDELKRLYQHDSDWNAILPVLDEGVSQGEFSLWEFLGGFQELPEEITLQNVRPAMSTVVYRTKCSDWSPDRFAEGMDGYDSLDKVYSTLNPQENTLVIVTTRRVSVDWAQIDEIHNWDWQLYVLHWDKANGLLFIHNSSNSGFFKKLAQAVSGNNAVQVNGPTIFRCMAGVNRLKLQNVGLLEQLGRLIRYTMRAGSDVEPGLSETQKQKAIKANIFGQGYEKGRRSSIGCSYKGRIWSYRTTNLLTLTTWCREVGARLLDENLDPEEVLRGTLVPTLIAERPSKIPISVEWPDAFYKEPEQAFAFEILGRTVHLYESDLILVDPQEDGPLKFAVVAESAKAEFALTLRKQDENPDYAIEAINSESARLIVRGKPRSLREFFEENPPTFWFADGASLTGNEHVALRRQPEPFPKARIESWTWTGTNIRQESQGIERNQKAIQYRVITEMKKDTFSVIFDDDDAGESADVVGIKEQVDCIEVEFWHCKFALADTPGSRIKELYEVCGQAQKSIRWLEKPRDLFTHLMRREPRRYNDTTETRYEVGSANDLLRIREKTDSQPVRLKIYIVQPGLSKGAVSKEQLELLAVTDNYLRETFAVPFGIVGSD